MASIEAQKSWLKTHMPQAFLSEVPEKEQEIVAHTLAIQENLEEDVHLTFGASHAIVVGLDDEVADERILKHYGESRIGCPDFKVYVSKDNASFYGANKLPLRITRLSFCDLHNDKEEMLDMPENVCPKLVEEAKERDAVQYKVFQSNGVSTLCFAWRNVQRRQFLGPMVAMFRRYHLKLQNMKFSYVKPLSVQSLLIGKIELKGDFSDEVCREFELLKGFRADGLVPLVENGVLTGNQANLLRAFTPLIGQILADVDPAMYSEENIIEAFTAQVSLTVDLIALFESKCNPAKVDLALFEKLCGEFEAKLKTLDTGMKTHDNRRRAIFYQALNIMKHLLRTNFYECDKVAISFRLCPKYMDNIPGFDRTKKFPDMPFGITYIRGNNFFGFQVRFRDLARGGMRTVVSRDSEHEANERPNMFSECYNLAYTQQKKNKDIPEGGSKAIVFVRANLNLAKDEELAKKELKLEGLNEEQIKAELAQFRKDHSYEHMYYNQRCFAHTFLKSFIWDHEKKCLQYGPHTVDHLKRAEYIYLGPDENFTDQLIDWVAEESRRLKYYPVGGAFISGKDKVGVSHKAYGVTSWGVLQYLKEVLHYKGWDTKKFTVKITGGPDGDVAGNTMLLLAKYYPTQALVLEITDGSGCAYDPEGFNLEALSQMFHKVQMMHDYPAELLHEGGYIVCGRKTRQATPLSKEVLRLRKEHGKVVEEWISFSEANHLWSTLAHTVKTDVFMPCGGRPRALNMQNIETVLNNGVPTFEAIVEGANLYVTADAREFLEDKGVLIYRDSSSNKCGVMSSSYEILGGLSMTDEQFIEVKPELAKNILERLELVAQAEAKCMMQYWLKNEKKIRMTKISELVSSKINKYTDEMAAYLKDIDLMAPENKALLDIFVNYIPACIRNKYLDGAMKHVPDMHKKAIISTKIACDLVYGKGLDWEPSVPDILPILLKQH